MVQDPAPASKHAGYELLLELAASLTGAHRPEELYRIVYQRLSQVLEASGFFISTYDEARDLATVVFQVEAGEEREDPIVFRGSDSHVIRWGKPLRIDDELESHALMTVGHADSPPTRSALSVPLRHGGRIRGVVSVQSYAPDAYSSADLKLLQGVADLVAVAVDAAWQLRTGQLRRRELERVQEIGCLLAETLHAGDVMEQVLDAALELLQGDGAALWLVEESSVRVAASAGPIAVPIGTVLPLEGEVVRLVREEKASLVLDDVKDSPLLPEAARALIQARSALLVPLMAGDEVLGGLSVGTRSTRHFRDDEKRLLERLANHGALALRNARLHAELQALSLTDPLTQLPNRRHLELHIGREMAAADRGRSLSGVLFDLDNFKGFNDSQGHVAGDEVLRAVGRVLAEETRAMNLVARYGGDEFFAVLSDTTLAGADYHARRVQERFARDPFLSARGITISFGAAAYNNDMDGPDDLIHAADDALYGSKGLPRGGESRTVAERERQDGDFGEAGIQ